MQTARKVLSVIVALGAATVLFDFGDRRVGCECRAAALQDAESCALGTLSVFEDRTAGTGRRIAINVVVIPAIGGEKKGPIFQLEGGPGAAATDDGPDMVNDPDLEFLRSHDIVLVDQRGTGSSNLLQCALPSSPQDFFGRVENNPERLKSCLTQLEKKADLTRYGTSLAADDLDDYEPGSATTRSSCGWIVRNQSGAGLHAPHPTHVLRRDPRWRRSVRFEKSAVLCLWIAEGAGACVR